MFLFILFYFLQYIYWEKVHPRGCPIYDPNMSVSPLMNNWTESKALERDLDDDLYGRGCGDVMRLF